MACDGENEAVGFKENAPLVIVPLIHIENDWDVRMDLSEACSVWCCSSRH